MRLDELNRVLQEQDRQGRWLFTAGQLRRLAGDSPKAFDAAVARHCERGLLQRVAHGLYANPHARSTPSHRLEAVARQLRPMHHTYVSLESRLSELGLIGQIPGVLTVMTSGRSRRCDTAYGTIEFTHTGRDIPSLIDSRQVYWDEARGIHVATAERARSDLTRVGRNLDLLQAEAEENGGRNHAASA
jgi:predicted transcriptional regulator of viral defense system